MVDPTKFKKEEYEYVYCIVYLPMNMADPTKHKEEDCCKMMDKHFYEVLNVIKV